MAGSSPLLARLAVRNSGYPVRPDTEVVIEGFPRSGNTFAVVAFLRAQPREVRVAHHVHLPSQFLEAERRGLPAMLLLRDPEETVLSLAVRLPHLTVRQVLRAFVRFHRPLVRRTGAFVTVPFQVVRTDLGAGIRALNERFGTRFDEFDPTPEHLASVTGEIEAADRATFGRGEGYERAAAVPSATRQRLKDDLRAAYHAQRLSSLRRLADALHAALLASSTIRLAPD